MRALTTEIKFELNEQLKEVATIQNSDCGKKWAFVTSRGYNGWDADWNTLPSSFEAAYKALKQYEKDSLKELKY